MASFDSPVSRRSPIAVFPTDVTQRVRASDDDCRLRGHRWLWTVSRGCDPQKLFCCNNSFRIKTKYCVGCIHALLISVRFREAIVALFVLIRSFTRCVLLPWLCVCLLVACQSVVSAEPEQILSRTTWDLIAIQGPGDQSVPILPSEMERFRLRFEAGRHVLLRLDCNRGVAKRSGDIDSASAGRIRFSIITVTRAICPPPNLDQRVLRDLSFVRFYEIRSGRLYLSPTADGGVLEWQRRAKGPAKPISP